MRGIKRNRLVIQWFVPLLDAVAEERKRFNRAGLSKLGGIQIKKFYVASSFKNIDMVRLVSMRIKESGFVHTYDWTENERASTIEDLKRIGLQEKNAVLDADFLIVLLPAGKGSHIEFGIALGQGKTIYLYSLNDDLNNFEITSTFYHLSNVEKLTGTIDDLINKVTRDQMILS